MHAVRDKGHGLHQSSSSMGYTGVDITALFENRREVLCDNSQYAFVQSKDIISVKTYYL